MRPEVKERNQRRDRQQMNQCPTHGTRLDITYYDDLDLQVTKCRDAQCIHGHSMTENIKYKKRKRHDNWVKKNAQKIIDDTDTPRKLETTKS